MSVNRLGVEPNDRLAGSDGVAVLDQPLDDRATVRGDDRVLVT
jgi:hypothetical protein